MNLKKENSGRSMIEMLGVLAIIAVLTVVGLEGFGKAMQMWKSNIQRQTIAELVAATIKIKPNLNPQSTTYDNLTPTIYAMGDLPEGTIYQNNSIYDKEGNYFRVMYGLGTWTKEDGSQGSDFYFAIYLYFPAQSSSWTPTMQDSCRNIMLTLQPVANEIKKINFSQTNSTKWNNYSETVLFTNTTLAKATLTDIQQKCSMAIENGEARNFIIYLNPY